jgi:hypothetical protein
VTFDDIKRLVHLIAVKFSNEFFRVVCVARHFDNSFFQPEWLQEKMTIELVTKSERVTISGFIS